MANPEFEARGVEKVQTPLLFDQSLLSFDPKDWRDANAKLQGNDATTQGVMPEVTVTAEGFEFGAPEVRKGPYDDSMHIDADGNVTFDDAIDARIFKLLNDVDQESPGRRVHMDGSYSELDEIYDAERAIVQNIYDEFDKLQNPSIGWQLWHVRLGMSDGTDQITNFIHEVGKSQEMKELERQRHWIMNDMKNQLSREE